MKFKTISFFAAGVLCTVATLLSVMAFTPKSKANPTVAGKFMIVTTIESIIPGGLGRSRMFVTDESGKMVEEAKMENFYSLVGINMKNVNENDMMIVNKINKLTGDGWELFQVNTGVQSPSTGPDGNKGEGVYMTRYFFKK